MGVAIIVLVAVAAAVMGRKIGKAARDAASKDRGH